MKSPGSIPERTTTRRYRVEWGHLVFVSAIALATVLYLADAMQVSLDMNNLLFIAPVGAFALLMYCLILPQCFVRTDRPVRQRRVAHVVGEPAGVMPDTRKGAWQIGLLAAAMGLMVFLLDVIGFDVAIWLFSLAVMLICGERRPLVLLIFPLACAGLIVAGFRAMLPYPLYTAII